VTAARWITLENPAPLHATVELAPGWKPVRIEGDFSVRHAVAHDVPIDAANGHIFFAGHTLQATDAILIQGDNLAYGSYSMDTTTLDYRFLLKAAATVRHLRMVQGLVAPFLAELRLRAAPPAADIDIIGRWGTAAKTSIFCQADAPAPASGVSPLTGYRPHSSSGPTISKSPTSQRNARAMPAVLIYRCHRPPGLDLQRNRFRRGVRP